MAGVAMKSASRSLMQQRLPAARWPAGRL